MTDGILFKASVRNNPYVPHENRDNTWKDRDDDTIPEGYPTLHFGESFYSAMLGGEVQFVGTASHTCSGAKPLISSRDDLPKLSCYENSYWTKVFKETATYFATEAGQIFG